MTSSLSLTTTPFSPSGQTINDLIVAINAILANQSALITGGTINGAVIGGSTPAAGTFTTLTATAGTLNGVTIGGSSPAAGTFTTITGTAITATDVITQASTLGTTNPATQRNVYGKLTLNYAGNVTIGGGTGSVAGVRGEILGATGTTLKDGFYYGTQGKFGLNGATIDQTSAARFCGVLAQLDVSSGTMTAGQLSALWADMGASAAGAFAAETNIIRATNTTSQAVNAHLYSYGKATYFADISSNTSACVATPAGSTASGTLRTLQVLVDGTALRILCAQTYS